MWPHKWALTNLRCGPPKFSLSRWLLLESECPEIVALALQMLGTMWGSTTHAHTSTKWLTHISKLGGGVSTVSQSVSVCVFATSTKHSFVGCCVISRAQFCPSTFEWREFDVCWIPMMLWRSSAADGDVRPKKKNRKPLHWRWSWGHSKVTHAHNDAQWNVKNTHTHTNFSWGRGRTHTHRDVLARMADKCSRNCCRGPLGQIDAGRRQQHARDEPLMVPRSWCAGFVYVRVSDLTCELRMDRPSVPRWWFWHPHALARLHATMTHNSTYSTRARCQNGSQLYTTGNACSPRSDSRTQQTERGRERESMYAHALMHIRPC